MSENLLREFQTTPSFAIWDGEHAVLRFTGKLNHSFVKVDSKGNEQTYLGLEVFLIEHSNEQYSHRHDDVLFLRTGRESTLAKWALSPTGVEWKDFNDKTIYKLFNSAKLGFDLRIESMPKAKNSKGSR